MVDHKRVYQQEGNKYQRLIAREDFTGNLFSKIQEIVPQNGLDVVDLGSGTGRLASLLGPVSGTIFAFDKSSHMLSVATGIFEEVLEKKWLAAAADHRAIPLPSQSADLILSGWSFCYLVVWEEGNWQSALLEALKEAQRVLREGGTLMLIETLGTGVKDPQPPEDLVPYFNFLEDLNFERTWIRTDYKFHDQEEAHELVDFFFGEEMLFNISQDSEPILPECTGIWWHRNIGL